MASFKKSPSKKFSRVKNDLAELQRWWPAFIKDDGVLGISVDPVLYRTNFGTYTDDDGDESRVAGIRVESITDAGADVSGTEPTIVISGSGTFEPKCTINHADGTSTDIMLIAPDRGVASGTVTMNFTDSTGDSDNGAIDVTNDMNDVGMNGTRTGPYPVFMTVQELAEVIDTYRHIGQADTDKKAWLPHGVISPLTAALPAIGSDPRITNTDPLPTTSPYRATVFMPMMLDNNQFSKDIAGSATLWGGHHSRWDKNGISRYDSDPEGEDSATIKYKRYGNSGDHQKNSNKARTTQAAAVWTSQDSSDCPAPKYRMAMALACFLKDGTYSLNDGAIIPYSYDSNRTIGGVNTDTMYMTWNGREGYKQTPSSGGALDNNEKYPAGIYPLFDFVQGPITPRAQASNWTHAVLADHVGSDAYPLRYEIPPNSMPFDILAVEVAAQDASPLPLNGHAGKQFTVRVSDVTSSNEPAHTSPLIVGQAVYIQGVNGVLGYDTDMRKATGQLWPTRYDTRRPSGGNMDCNGWWIVSEVNTTEFTNEIEYRFNVHPDLLPVVASYTPTSVLNVRPLICAGRQGGPEIAFNTFFVDNAGSPIDGPIEDGMGILDGDATEAKNPIVPKTDFQVSDGRPSSPSIGTGYQAGMGQGDLNVPVASSRNDTAPARPTIAETGIIDNLGEFTGNRPVPRSIHIQTLGVTPNENIPSAPPVITSSNGSLRLPAPLGHDLCTRYNSVGENGITTYGGATNLQDSVWRVRSDLDRADDATGRKSMIGGPDRWAWRGVSTPLISYIDGNTGRHAWDYIKPEHGGTTWTFGRNRPWPAHERLGTRLSMSPSLFPTSLFNGWDSGTSHSNRVSQSTETTKIGLSEIGCSPIFLDMEVTAFIPNQDNRMVIIDFDMNEADDMLGRHHMIHSLPNRDMGFGFRPRWDATTEAGVYRKDVFTLADGTAATVTPTPINPPLTYNDWIKTAGIAGVVAGDNPNWAGFPIDAKKSLLPIVGGHSDSSEPPYPLQTTNNRPSIWFLGGASHWVSEDWVGNQPFTLPSVGGFGRMGTGFGQGPSFAFSEGTNKIRSVFTSGGMTLVFNGSTIGTDISADEPVWGLQFKACNAFAMTDRRPYWLKNGSSLTLVPTDSPYTILGDEESFVHGQRANTDFTNARTSVDRRYYSAGIDPPNVWANVTDNYPNEFPAGLASLTDGVGRMTRADYPSLQQSNVDFSIDDIVMRQIPTPAMLPFTVDTLTQQAVGITPARYSSLIIEADNINPDDKKKVTVTLLEPPTSSTIAQEASTVITGFENLDPDFLGGVGSIDLSGLPATVVASGFVIRFNFFIPSSEDTTLHPLDWSSLPIVRSYTIYYDHKPTSEATILGNTYDGSTATTIGTSGTQTFTTKVGHIVSLRMQGDTTDPDRTITHLKTDFGDGSITEWLPVTTPASSATYDISHVFSTRPVGGTYDIVVYAKDDNANESVASDILRATIVAAEPVAIVRAVPSMVRAGQPIRFDGSDSYTIDTAASITSYTWTFGDGSSSVSGAAIYQDHTYAEAGEFMATLVVNDGTSNSPTAKAVVKVLPATLVVPLTLSTTPSSFRRTRTASLTRTPILDAVYPEVSDMGQRGDEFTLSGMFLKSTQDTDIAFMEELLFSGSLVEFAYQDVNYDGVTDSKIFTGRMVSFDYNREGGNTDRTPYTAVFVREAGLGA
ncbi:PKD domain-containing protein [bacterium]|nr:PKD domain-containing protein [bacterium]